MDLERCNWSERILIYRLIASNATIPNEQYEEELDICFVRRVSEFPNGAIANIG